MSRDLKPCPFCGEDDLKIHEQSVRDFRDYPTGESQWFVSCRGDCFFAGPSSMVSIEDAVLKWNKRNDNSKSPITATGKQLDYIGEMIGFPRVITAGRPQCDNEYREMLLIEYRKIGRL